MPEARAARIAAKPPSATPTWHSCPVCSTTRSTSASASASSDPWNLLAPSAGSISRPGRATSNPATTVSTAAATCSKVRASRPSSTVSSTSSGQHSCA